MTSKTRILIMGAAGRDFHNFNTAFRDNEQYEVVAFTATQIPDIVDRKYPAELAGKLYPEGIPIYDEKDLPRLIKELNVDEVVFSYSDVPHTYVMHKAALVNACGAKFSMMGTKYTQVKTDKPLISVCAVRTGCGKSQTSRKIVDTLHKAGKKIVAIRHPMPYGDLVKQKVQRFATYEDLDKHECTIEEREEYEPYIDRGLVIYAGVDYEAILREAEKEADVILWDGGNNDFPFYTSDQHLNIVVADPHRVGHEKSYYPGETNVNLADVIVVNKVVTAKYEDILKLEENLREINPNATIIEAASPIFVEKPELVKGKRVLVIEDGPTLTHGEMKYGAGIVAAKRFGAKEIIDPRPWLVGSLKETFEKYPEIGTLLPAMGYFEQQLKDLEETINAVDCDVVVSATPIDLTRLIKINKPVVRVRYELEEIGYPKLEDILKEKGYL
ncbi:MAG: cyclic 2,3-diphosphoglycerate synthase [Candidatus Heimdallarchaeum endolithica]|uniref:Cyclic 2,3-diphosphoglycerate synthase n=1 Tax=Candidatus Heimdallarchaeum endolithica TaxID=2876572 RepID=A0A9Y1BPE7_9ARCH|nr:MAG: cyclic 2,3-diphosphoglycerate synthase [Candidatus Heimdallarchaeum endolithica]